MEEQMQSKKTDFRKKREKYLGIGFELSVRIVLIFVILSLIICVFSYFMYRNECIKQYGSEALAIAKAVAKTIDGNEFLTIIESGEKTEYWHWVKNYLDETATVTGAKYAYVITEGENGGNEYRYFATAFFDVEVGYIQSSEHFAKEIGDTLKNGTYTNSKVYNAGSDEQADYGMLISGFAPIYNAKGEIIGAVGIDIGVAEAFHTANRFGGMLLTVVILLVIIITLISILYIKRYLGRPIELISEASRNLADGNMNILELPFRNDEIGFLAEDFQRMQLTVKGLSSDIHALVQQASAGQLYMRAKTSKYSGSWNDLLTELNNLLNAYDTSRNAIVEGINYASKIQRNILPTKDIFEKAFSDYSIIWEPRDVVGGDIYWLKNFEEGSVLCVCDCTGHGTSGAFLTMLTISAFETIINENTYKDTANTIWELDQKLTNLLNVNKADSAIKDGCDLAVLYIAKDGNVTISTGNTRIFICDGKEVTHLKGQRIYVGEGEIKNKDDINVITIKTNPDNKFYIASDGMYDQIGDETMRPFGFKKFMQIILENHYENQEVISAKVWDAFKNHCSSEARFDDFELITFKP